ARLCSIRRRCATDDRSRASHAIPRALYRECPLANFIGTIRTTTDRTRSWACIPLRPPTASIAYLPLTEENTMAHYVHGFVVPVPKRKIAAYVRMSRKAGKLWREHGALEYFECVSDDVKPGKQTSFPQSVKLKPGEVVVFAWILYKSRTHRD